MKIVSERLFRVAEGSETYKAIQQYLDAHIEAHKAWSEFCEKYGAEQMYSSDTLQGLLFDRGKQPEGWINPKHCGHSRAYRPNLRDKSCAEAAKEFKALPGKPSSLKWLEMLGIPFHVGNRGSFKTPGFKKIGETYYLTASEGCAVPDDVEEVTSKEAQALQEKHEAEQDREAA